ncbi:hypothetical protein GCM10022403_005860 [Streptomyces coacervatus]|uniref:Uncharacterized protein n=1 Tax=Streptomyces coacervatus TaxID=647381 RepID=A0ABP7GRS1_9ACTN
MTYASCPAASFTDTGLAGCATDAGSSRATTGRSAGSESDPAFVTAHTAPASASMKATRSAGSPGSTGTYAAPAIHTPTIAVTMSTPRGRLRATTDSGPTPDCRSRRARRFACATNIPYESSVPSQITAVASGVRAAWAAISCGTESAGIAAAVSFHSTSAR